MSTHLDLASQSVTDRPPIRTRWYALTLLSALGVLAYVPALNAMGARVGVGAALALTLLVGAVCGIAAWLGLRWADRAGLPMPWLRAFEQGRPVPSIEGRGLLLALGGGAAMAVAALIMLRGFDIPNMQGSLAARLSSTLFAAVTLEVVIHLGMMSGLVAWTRSRWAGILGATVIFVLFHASGASSLALPIFISAIVLNGVGGVFFGWLYARFGFEYLVVAHAVSHALACAVG